MYDELLVIPARYRSSRLPGKPLIDIAGIPMIVRTAQRCLEVMPRDQVIVATDDDRIAEVCHQYDIRVEMTRDDHPTGGDRVAEIASRIPAKTYINIQGDEPVFNTEDIRTLIAAAREDRSKVLTGYCPLNEEEWLDSKYIKLLFGLNEQLIYIGRASVPGSHDGKFRTAYRHVCAYAYSRESLELFASTNGRTPLESIEDHEIMRFLELGYPVQVVRLSTDSMPVDRPDDVVKVEHYLAQGERLTEGTQGSHKHGR
jgi:3-deoxy-manno-octulosonate cytidylyltransferase (CMP-KDO synthetase)